MPRSIVPHKSGLHRSTCLSLYRALLRECGRLPTTARCHDPNSPARIFQSLVRYRFEKDRAILSPTQICHGIEAGSRFLDLLRSCNDNSTEALTRLCQIVESVTLEAEHTALFRKKLASFWKPPPPHRAKYLENIKKIKDKANQTSTPSHPRIFEHPRPLSEVKAGVRKVPNLIVTQGIPVLKYPGPQPVLLNRVIKQRTKWGVKMFQQHKTMENGAHLAHHEDDWDAILYRHHKISYPEDRTPSGGTTGVDRPSTAAPGGTWASTFRQVDQELEQKVQERGRKNAELGRRLWQIVLDERELKEKERKEAKHQRRMARKSAAAGLPTINPDGPGNDESSTTYVR
ncbi:hypothetical protein A1O3_09585 [Capronia epimyces CBS 606.96]|uniref:Complex 1 LYR protein domain-containing protein n=1 Tax=Capronia epimyces CBS 606.96 TaxID=1182542 RepID=W9Y4J5_9EURO|nr:uncharacterized protein A1O3_09585 [Capronia epimyces CBS 606.96]EXJ77359.1 hypothetical protein A1O3_09585 [Capronia epimyces CBS 606.96]